MTLLPDSDNGQEEPTLPLTMGFEKDETFKELIRQLVDILLKKRSPFLRKRAVKFIMVTRLSEDRTSSTKCAGEPYD